MIKSSNYPNLQRICIQQDRALSDAVLPVLGKFPKLKYLWIDCPLQSPEQIAHSIPPSLKKLELADRSTITDQADKSFNLGNISHLELFKCTLNRSFASQCTANNLRTITITNVKIEKGALMSLTKFKTLKTLRYFYSAGNSDTISTDFKEELRFLRRHGIKTRQIKNKWC